jgi:hypothetical protein
MDSKCMFCDDKATGVYDRIRYCNEHWFDAQMAKG